MAIIGISKPFFAKYSVSGGSVSYASGAALGKATSADITINAMSKSKLYADNALCESDASFRDGTVKLGLDELGQDVAKEILGLQSASVSGTGISDPTPTEILYDNRQNAPFLGIGFIAKHKKNGALAYRGIVFNKVQFDNPDGGYQTQGEEINWQTDSISGTIMRAEDTNQTWKSEATFTTEAQAEAYIKQKLNIT